MKDNLDNFFDDNFFDDEHTAANYTLFKKAEITQRAYALLK